MLCTGSLPYFTLSLHFEGVPSMFHFSCHVIHYVMLAVGVAVFTRETLVEGYLIKIHFQQYPRTKKWYTAKLLPNVRFWAEHYSAFGVYKGTGTGGTTCGAANYVTATIGQGCS